MKSLFTQALMIAFFGLVGTQVNAKAITTAEALRAEETRLIEEIIANDLQSMDILSSFEIESKIYIYDTEGNLLKESSIKEWNSSEMKKILAKSDFLAEVDGSQYFLFDCK